MMEDGLLIDGPREAAHTIVLAHGAGAAMDSPFMDTVAEGLARNGIRVVRFEFPYMMARREGGKRGAPDREAVLIEAWRDVIARLGGGTRLVIGGKSLAGVSRAWLRTKPGRADSYVSATRFIRQGSRRDRA